MKPFNDHKPEFHFLPKIDLFVLKKTKEKIRNIFHAVPPPPLLFVLIHQRLPERVCHIRIHGNRIIHRLHRIVAVVA